jgi:outer membrane protein assembly factor BamB
MKHNSIRPTSLIYITFLLVFGICTSSLYADEFDWPRWRGPNGDGISMETDWDPEALAGGPNILWKVDVGIGHSNVALEDNRLYTFGKRTVFCFNAETGKEIWQYSFERFCMAYPTPTIDDKYIYVLNTEGTLVCLKAKNGKLRWKRDLVEEYTTEKIPYGYAGSPIIEGDLIILNVNTAGIALDKKTGDLIWASNIHTTNRNTNGYHATPVLYDHEGKRCALLLSGTGVYSVEIETGKQLWYFEFITPGAQAADPVLFEHKVFISSGGGYPMDRGALFEITGNEPKEVWENKNMINEFSACVYVDGYLYGSDGNHGTLAPFRCIDAKTGDVLWEKKMKMASLTAADEKLIILEEDGVMSYRASRSQERFIHLLFYVMAKYTAGI